MVVHEFLENKKRLGLVIQGGPLQLISAVIVITSLTGVPMYRPSIGVTTPCITSRGPPCTVFIHFEVVRRIFAATTVSLCQVYDSA